MQPAPATGQVAGAHTVRDLLCDDSQRQDLSLDHRLLLGGRVNQDARKSRHWSEPSALHFTLAFAAEIHGQVSRLRGRFYRQLTDPEFRGAAPLPNREAE